MKYKGSCHCGRIEFEAEGEIKEVMSCNCTMCARKGWLMWFIPRSALTLSTPEEQTSVYLFNKHVIKHRFCSNCGIHPYGESPAPDGRQMAAVNVRCLEDVDIGSIPVKEFDGLSVP